MDRNLQEEGQTARLSPDDTRFRCWQKRTVGTFKAQQEGAVAGNQWEVRSVASRARVFWKSLEGLGWEDSGYYCASQSTEGTRVEAERPVQRPLQEMLMT